MRRTRHAASAGTIVAMVVASVLALLAPSAQAGQSTLAGVTAAGTTATAAADRCVYYVRYNYTPVQENPDTDSVVRKYKRAGSRVTGPCRAAYDVESRTWFTAVDCSCATRGKAWIRSYWLY
jgi:hypothetical protein